MTKLNKMGVGAFALILAVGASVIAQVFSSTYAVNTLVGDNEVITIGGTTDGQPVNAPVYPVGYSSDGNIIVFSTQATNLPDAGGTGVFSYNVRAGQVDRVDISTAGVIPDRSASSIQVSETGRYITFLSSATNLVSQTLTYQYDNVYMRDMQEQTTTFVGGGNIYQTNNNNERNLGVSSDGRFILIASRYIKNTYPYAYGIVYKDNNITSGSKWTSLGIGTGNEGSWSSTAVRGGLSCDGSFAVYQKIDDINLADLRNSTTAKKSEATYYGGSPIISCNGRYILYTTLERTLISPTPAGLSEHRHHLVRYDRVSGDRMYINSNSSGVFTAGLQSVSGSEPHENAYEATVADTGDVVFKYEGNMYLKHLSDGSGTLEPIARAVGGNYLSVQNGSITRDGKYIYFRADPYDLGLSSSSLGLQYIRTKTNL